MTWKPRPSKVPWRDYLTEDEAATVRDCDRKLETARYESAMASMVRTPIVNRAINRAKYAARAKQSTPLPNLEPARRTDLSVKEGET